MADITGRRALVVCRNPGLAKKLKELLGKIRCDVHVVSNVEELNQVSCAEHDFSIAVFADSAVEYAVRGYRDSERIERLHRNLHNL